MELVYVEPNYDVMKEKEILMYSKTQETGSRLDVVVIPINPYVGVDSSSEVNDAFGSVILNVVDLTDEALRTPAVWSALYKGEDTEDDRAAVLGAAKKRVAREFPELRNDERTAYVCPIVAGYGAGYRHGYVVAWEESDALTVAEFMAGGRVEIYLDQLNLMGQRVGGELLGNISYSDLVCDTDTYHRIIKGEQFAKSVAWHLGIEAPEPNDLEYPGAELLETFKKLS